MVHLCILYLWFRLRRISVPLEWMEQLSTSSRAPPPAAGIMSIIIIFYFEWKLCYFNLEFTLILVYLSQDRENTTEGSKFKHPVLSSIYRIKPLTEFVAAVGMPKGKLNH